MKHKHNLLLKPTDGHHQYQCNQHLDHLLKLSSFFLTDFHNYIAYIYKQWASYYCPHYFFFNDHFEFSLIKTVCDFMDFLTKNGTIAIISVLMAESSHLYLQLLLLNTNQPLINILDWKKEQKVWNGLNDIKYKTAKEKKVKKEYVRKRWFILLIIISLRIKLSDVRPR